MQHDKALKDINYLPRVLTSRDYTLLERYLRQRTRARNHLFETSLTRLDEQCRSPLRLCNQ